MNDENEKCHYRVPIEGHPEATRILDEEAYVKYLRLAVRKPGTSNQQKRKIERELKRHKS